MNQPQSQIVRGKYAPLFNHLRALEDDEWPASFAEIEAVLGFSLPRSARTYQAWWSNQYNSGSHTHAQSWQRAGWKARNVNLRNEVVIFKRAQTARPRSGGDISVDSVAPTAGGRIAQRAVGNAEDQQISVPGAGPAHTLFEQLARWVMSDTCGTKLQPGKLPEVNKIFDMTSTDGSVVGDAKYYAMVGGERLPPAKFSVIAEHVWLLEKTDAKRKFLVFGNDRRVPEKWLEKYGDLVSDVAFYFLSDDGQLEVLREEPQ